MAEVEKREREKRKIREKGKRSIGEISNKEIRPPRSGSPMAGQKPISEDLVWTPVPIGRRKTQEASGNNIFGVISSCDAFIQPTSSASNSSTCGFPTTLTLGSTGTAPSVASTSASGSEASGKIGMKCASCGGSDWVPYMMKRAFGTTTTPTFGSTGTAFAFPNASTSGIVNKTVFESSSTPAFDSSSAPSFSITSSQAFIPVEDNPFGYRPVQSSPLGGSDAASPHLDVESGSISFGSQLDFCD